MPFVNLCVIGVVYARRRSQHQLVQNIAMGTCQLNVLSIRYIHTLLHILPYHLRVYLYRCILWCGNGDGAKGAYCTARACPDHHDSFFVCSLQLTDSCKPSTARVSGQRRWCKG
jgi:hypothetical protein